VHFLHPQGEQQIWAKCLLYIGNCHFFVGEVTDSGEEAKAESDAEGGRVKKGLQDTAARMAAKGYRSAAEMVLLIRPHKD
jgi:hypothetical protein